MRRYGIATLFFVAACGKNASPTDAGTAAPAASAADAKAAAVPSCVLARSFQGTIGKKLEVLARFDREGSILQGSYFYTGFGVDLPLAGTLSESGAISLVEGDAEKPSGQFTGTCDADGHLRGTWNKPGASDSLAFDLAPITPRDEVIVATKRKTRRFAPKPNPKAEAGMGFSFEPKEACIEEITWPELFGAGSPKAEAAMNRLLVNDHWFFTEKSSEDVLRTCLVGERTNASRTFDVMANHAGILSVREHESARYEGGTHPWDPGAETWLTFDTRTGTSLTRKELLPVSKTASAALGRLLDKCLVAYVRDAVNGEAAALSDMRTKVSLDNPRLLVLPTQRGLHFAATDYGPPARILEGEGPTITWAALMLAGALPANDAAARLWENIAPAKPTDDPCVKPRP